MKNDDTIDVLNSLITINNDRIEGYETASKETEEPDLKSLFGQFISTSRRCNQELISEVHALNGTAETGTTTSGKFFRVWMDVKAALTGKDRKAILNSCEFGEEHATDTYDKALENESEYLDSNQYSMISAQRAFLKADQEHIKVLCEALA